MFIVFDLDSTLADTTHRNHFILDHVPKRWDAFYRACVDDPPIKHTIELLKTLANSGHEVEIWSGRSDIVYVQTMEWLRNNKIHDYDIRRILMRRAGDHRSDVRLKSGWLHELHPDSYPDIVFEDRNRVVEMYRKNNVPCFQVAPGDF